MSASNYAVFGGTRRRLGTVADPTPGVADPPSSWGVGRSYAPVLATEGWPSDGFVECMVFLEATDAYQDLTTGTGWQRRHWTGAAWSGWSVVV